ncbi:MAG TPA: acyl-CoA thioesterase II [Pseudomonadales bacterium]
MSAALRELLELLALERIDENLFRAHHPKGREHRLYGGQIMAQALRAAAYTVVEDRFVHSLHGYFLRPGDPSVPALIDVEPIRDGRSFSTRRVVVIQHGQAIFNMDASFQVEEPGLTHQLEMPKRQPPTDDMVPAEMRTWAFLGWRHDHKRLSSSAAQPPCQDLWFRANGRLPDDPVLHACLAVYESDNALLGTARLPHRDVLVRERMQMASLDHAMWFHAKPAAAWRADEWLLYSLDSPSASQSRGYNRGMIFAADGTLVASTMQEGLMRQR